MKNLIYLLFISLSLILSACASFEDNKVTEVISLPDVSTYKNKPKVYIDFKYFMGNKNLEKATKNTKATEYLKPKIEEIIKESELFESYTFDEFEKDQMDYTLKLICL